MDGGLYNRQGAGYPIDIIKIEGKGKSEKPLPAVDIPPKYHSFAELKEVLKDVVLDGSARTNQREEVRDYSQVLDSSEAAGQNAVVHSQRTGLSRMPDSESRGTDEAGDSVRGDRQSLQRLGVMGMERAVSEFGEATERTARSISSLLDPYAMGERTNRRTPNDTTAPTIRTQQRDVSPISSDRRDGERGGGIDSGNGAEYMVGLSNNTTRNTARHGLDSDLQATYEPFSQGQVSCWLKYGIIYKNLRLSVLCY